MNIVNNRISKKNCSNFHCLFELSIPMQSSDNFYKIHNYYVGKKIGRGTFASVRICYNRISSLPMVAKITSKRRMNSATNQRIFFNERVLCSLLSQKNIYSVSEVIDAKLQTFQISEFCESNLMDVMRTKKLSTDALLRICDQILSALEYLHANHICHRDVKLENVLVTNKMQSRLCDFGLASVTFDGMVSGKCGSYRYAAPEVLLDDAECYDGPRADMWSCGVLFYAMFTHRFPYDVREEQIEQTNFENICFDGVPECVAPLIAALLDVNPARRPTSAEARDFECFSGIEGRDPHYKVNYDIQQPISNQQPLLVSRISQVFEESYLRSKAILQNAQPSLEKLVYFLFANKQKKNFIKRFHSCPVYGANLNMKEVKRTYLAESAEVVGEINAYLLPQNYCITSPISFERTVVLNKPDGDDYFQFECVDAEKGSYCTFSCIGPRNSTSSDNLIRYLDSKFEQK